MDSAFTAKPRMTKWQSVLDQVLADLAAERLAPGTRFHTVRELSCKYRVSQITAQRVFQELTARRLIVTNGRSGSTVAGEAAAQTVYLCLRDEHFDNMAQLDTFRILDAFLTGFRSGVDGLYANLKPISLTFLREHLDTLKGQPVLISGSVFLTITDTRMVIDGELVKRIRENLDPIVFFGYDGLTGLSQVDVDHYGGIRKAVDHLAHRHTRIGCLMGDPASVWFRPRLQAYMDGLLDNGLPFVPERLKITDSNDKANDFRAMDALMQANDPPTALVCANDRRALHAVEYCAQHGIAVPKRLAITGFDNMPESVVCRPAITTLDRQDHAAGRTAAELLWKRQRGSINKPALIRIEPKLIVRESA